MGKQKLIDSIKKDALKQIESDIKDSVVKEMYGTSKKAIKKMKKQILKELQKEMFAEAKASKKKKKNKVTVIPSFIPTNIEDIRQMAKVKEAEIREKEEEEEVSTYKPGQTMEYRGFKFDVDRMSAIVNGRNSGKTITEPGVERTGEKPKSTPYYMPSNGEIPLSGLPLINKLYEAKEGAKPKKESSSDKIKKERENRIDSIKKGKTPTPIVEIIPPSIPTGMLTARTPGIPFPGLTSMNMVPSSRNLVKVSEKITPAKKEEILFFIGKLKEGIDGLGKGQKNINYRKKSDDIYTFSYSKQKLDKDDFSFKFSLDLNLYTLGADIKRFEFNIDGFTFDKGFVEILDMISVLDVTGMSLRKYIEEISEINNSAEASKATIKENIKKNVKAIRGNTKLEKVIFDERILRVLRSNDVNTYGQLKKIEELTSLRGIGAKTASKIEELINWNQR